VKHFQTGLSSALLIFGALLLFTGCGKQLAPDAPTAGLPEEFRGRTLYATETLGIYASSKSGYKHARGLWREGSDFLAEGDHPTTPAAGLIIVTGKGDPTVFNEPVDQLRSMMPLDPARGLPNPDDVTTDAEAEEAWADMRDGDEAQQAGGPEVLLGLMPAPLVPRKFEALGGLPKGSLDDIHWVLLVPSTGYISDTIDTMIAKEMEKEEMGFIERMAAKPFIAYAKGMMKDVFSGISEQMLAILMVATNPDLSPELAARLVTKIQDHYKEKFGGQRQPPPQMLQGQ
jgi:hypothetical protein